MAELPLHGFWLRLQDELTRHTLPPYSANMAILGTLEPTAPSKPQGTTHHKLRDVGYAQRVAMKSISGSKL